MNELGRLEDLPADYREALSRQNLVPLWPSLRAVLPPDKPQPRTRAIHWSYEALRPLLMKAGELTPIEKAERRVLVLAGAHQQRAQRFVRPVGGAGARLRLARWQHGAQAGPQRHQVLQCELLAVVGGQVFEASEFVHGDLSVQRGRRRAA